MATRTEITERVAKRDQLIREMFVEGRYTDAEIAQALGLHRMTVTQRRLALGIRKSDREPPRAA